MRKKIIFLVYWPVTRREKEAWGFALLKSHGFDVQVCDVTNLFNQKAIEKNPVANELKDGCVLKINCFEELSLYLKNNAEDAIFVDYIRGLTDLDAGIEKLFRFLKKYNVRYFTIVTGALPTADVELKSLNEFQWFLNRIKKVFNLKALSQFIIRRAIIFLRRSKRVYPLPVRIFSTDAPLLEQFLKKYDFDKKNVTKLHSPDYYEFLRMKSRRKKYEYVLKPYCVFVDGGIVGHSDFDICGIQKLNPKSYIIEINNIIRHVEEKIGVRVKVAAHPKVSLENLQKTYLNGEIVQGKTLELVENAEFVITHFSSVIGYAALFKKPVIFVETIEMREIEHYHNAVRLMANALGMKPFQSGIDELDELEEYRKAPMSKYEQYVSKYVKTTGASDKPMWEVIIEELENGLLE
ncbi:hypothetical protein [Anaeroarcus burkinensis]|uniref:hypothetical protein n=1 Tax=Anaeroarcus burkinensis TaxID=82376 RepID=UPI00041382C7|nr:hypothetical protein [Anaeroarcus burkinensis]